MAYRTAYDKSLTAIDARMQREDALTSLKLKLKDPGDDISAELAVLTNNTINTRADAVEDIQRRQNELQVILFATLEKIVTPVEGHAQRLQAIVDSVGEGAWSEEAQ